MSEKIRAELFKLQDREYKEFHCRLMPTVEPERVIGVRTPDIRRLAKELSGTPEAEDFLNSLPHMYYDENNLHGALIGLMKSFDEAVEAAEKFLPYIDNWATCDLMSPKAFRKNLPELYRRILRWTASGETYTVRFGIEMLMTFYLDENFRPEMAELVAGIKSEEYYVNMMIAWYFAAALCKQYDAAIKILEGGRLDKWCHNKAIQKAVESRRISQETKDYLRTLKR